MSNEIEAIDAEDGDLYGQIRTVLGEARSSVAQSVNVAMVHAYWHIGRLIDRHVNAGTRSESYGADLLANLARRLRVEFGPGFEASNLRYMRLFYEAFEIHHAARDESFASRLRMQIDVQLSWTHYRLLTKVHRLEARRYYMDEAVAGRWSTRELERQILSRHFERGMVHPLPMVERRPAVEVSSAGSVLRDPYVLEFLGPPDRLVSTELGLEQALIGQLKAFLLELGRGFSFVGRQQRITVDGNHFHVDLVFYNYVLKCFVLIDLKAGELDHRDIGQMDFYVRYWRPKFALLMTTQRSDSSCVPRRAKQWPATHCSAIINRSLRAKYFPYLPSEDELQRELLRERHAFEMRQLGSVPDE